ncbi:LysR family transcriptional regulator [Asticcacaulis sp. DXS10W]|uniref:LysR family transcriptional regulator n=1 Tax=Asticcacaulis currens TaxID=2984210 RepID=A0ABT5IDG0_9CAUL|nr:LysR family transcriptional regulator [Asticcacaulis currens]MDC7694222.1 LysR family transcriptional regulator [Asticcacaulis currens]
MRKPPPYRDLALLIGIMQTGSLSAAGRQLGVPAATVSRRLASLEQQLGVELLRRSTRSCSLTIEAIDLLESLVEPFEEIATAVDGLSNHAGKLRGTVRVTCPVMAGRDRIGPTVTAFAADHPGLKVELMLSNRSVDVIGEGFDIAFRLGPIETDSRLVVRKLWDVPYMLAVHDDLLVRYPLLGTLQTPDDLGKVPCVVTPPMDRWRFQSESGRRRSVTPVPAFSVNDTELAIEAVRRGMGVGFLPTSLAERLGPSVKAAHVKGWRPVERAMLALFPPGAGRSPKVRALLNAFADLKLDER